MSQKEISETSPYFVQINICSLSSLVAYPPKRLRFAIFRNIQKLDQTQVIISNIKQQTNIKKQLTQPLTFKLAVTRKYAEYSLVLYEVIYSTEEKDSPVQEQIGTVKISIDKSIELSKQKSQDQPIQQTKDWLNGDIQLGYVINVHMDCQRYNQYAKKKIFRNALNNDGNVATKTTSQILPQVNTDDEVAPQQQQVHSEKKIKSPFKSDLIVEEDIEHDNIQLNTPMIDTHDIQDSENLLNDQKQGNTPKSPTTDFNQKLSIINQQQQITDKVQMVKMIIKRIPPHKFMLIIMGIIVIILLSPLFSVPQKIKNKSKKSKKA